MAVITDAERKKQRNRELKREYYAKTKKRGLRRAKNGIAKDAKKN